LRIADFGMRIAPSARRGVCPAWHIELAPSNPQSAIHNPQSEL